MPNCRIYYPMTHLCVIKCVMELLDFLIEQESEKVLKQPQSPLISPSFLPIRLSGGIGDVILSIPALEYMVARYQCLIYTGHASTLKYFAPALSSVSSPIPHFTWHLEVSSVCRFRMTDEFSGFLNRDHEKIFLTQRDFFYEDPGLKYLSKFHPHKDFLLARYAQKKYLTRATLPFYSLGLTPPAKEEKIIRKYKPNRYITIHDGYDVQSADVVQGRSTKQWDLDKWERLIRMIKQEFPKNPILQLGSKTGRPIQGVDQCLLSQTSITEAFDILSESLLHIDGDSGLTHAATALGVPCVVMFGPTPSYFYGYPQNTNLSSAICQGGCFWVRDEWMKQCPVGYTSPVCMDSIPVTEVFDAVRRELNKKGRPPEQMGDGPLIA